jgi:hypothetical protein
MIRQRLAHREHLTFLLFASSHSGRWGRARLSVVTG